MNKLGINNLYEAEMGIMELFGDEILKKRKDHIYCWLFNIGIEKEWMKNQFRVIDNAEDKIVQSMEEIMLFLAREQDIVFMRKIPDKGFLYKLKKMGFSIPQILCPRVWDTSKTITELILLDDGLLKKLKALSKEKEIYLMPYGVTEKEEILSEIIGIEIEGSAAEIVYKTNSKLYAKKLMRELCMSSPQSEICVCIQDIEKAWKKFRVKFRKVIIKQLYGASGQGLYVVDSEEKLKRVLCILGHNNSSDGQKWIVEGWYEEKIDLNAQIFLHKSGDVEIFSIKRQMLEEVVYKGSFFPLSISPKYMYVYRKKLLEIGKALYRDGVRGVVGIDSLMTRRDIFPVIEINVRFTLSTYLSFLPKIFKDRYFQSQYYQVSLYTGKEYEVIEWEIERAGVSFDREKSEGIFCYNPRCMNKEIVGEMGRLFIVIVSKNMADINKMHIEMDKILEGIRKNASRDNDKKTIAGNCKDR